MTTGSTNTRNRSRSLLARGRTVAVLVCMVGALAATGSNNAAANAVDQYVEFLPGPGREKPTREAGGVRGSASRYGLDGPNAAAIASIAALFDQGSDGSGPRVGERNENVRKAGEGNGFGEDRDEAPNVGGSVFGASADGGMGLLFPIALVLTLAVALIGFFTRRSADR